MPVAIVTGSDSGIGKATAVQLARAGHDVGITFDRDEQGASETRAEVESNGRRAAVRHLDLTRLPEAANVVDELAEELGGLDVLVNNSGTSRQAPFLDLAWEDWRGTLDVDLDGAFLCAQHAARRMVDAGRGGRIVNVTSVHEHVPLPSPPPTSPRSTASAASRSRWRSSSRRTGSPSTPSRRARSRRR